MTREGLEISGGQSCIVVLLVSEELEEPYEKVETWGQAIKGNEAVPTGCSRPRASPGSFGVS